MTTREVKSYERGKVLIIIEISYIGRERRGVARVRGLRAAADIERRQRRV